MKRKHQKNRIIKQILLSVLLISLLGGLLTGCATNNSQNTGGNPVIEEPKDQSKEILTSFQTLMAGNPKVSQVLQFINDNIKNASKEVADQMITELEKQQSAYMAELETKFYEEDIQSALIQLHIAKGDVNDPSKIDNEKAKAVVQDTKDSGFKVETAEGMFFPIPDYSVYRSFADYASDAMKAYIDIMATESDQVPAKDAALVIGWDEVIKRAMKQEAFVKNYPDSDKLEQVKQLYSLYVTYAMNGSNNTPLFSYDKNVMVDNAKDAYSKIDFSAADSEFAKQMKGYMELLKQSNYKLTAEVESYRRAAALKLEGKTPEASENKYYVAGINDAAAFEAAFKEIQKYIAEDNKEKVAEYVHYPLNVFGNDSKASIKDKAEFIAKYDKIITPEVKRAVAAQRVEELFVNYKGVMIGDGQVWIVPVTETTEQYKIFTINN